ncbi:threonine--tRNA ligase [Candidatus Roizmanbacteria bacterium RIFCSPHIGHO2_02_FULL_37_13b]|uniref:Threonine--tRNA ligase n=1 Tax=Candidatus Roizmanbacteria bacterium RIFCSPLOWO2_02_FULL_36_11 TaxID=1802071 RepID=A0A1F7JC07_9BACT|nr:MAG: threonine--tRNA ligase [Candidatus Roizmanbacteria bacterium RIFCSPHIGHO2_02_FULL_37_13b]OGK53131.1 MAG: threonine--tRNA ligase [Candidatus Roizmanbacteria bacterium RIFCSPLOWO2_02_FULL_36_11]
MENKNDYLQNLRHSCAHLLAKAVKDLWPGTHNAIGPAIENGFYQDFDFGKVKISEEDLAKIEKRMKQILPQWKKFIFNEVTLDEARALFKDNPYKIELAKEFAKDGKQLQTNDPGDFLDLCKMGHVDNPSHDLKHFKLLSVAGAYWRGDEKNKMLTRIYGTCFPSKDELDKYLWQLEEAKKRDHRILGKSLDLFVIDDNIGKGLPLLTPKGYIIRKSILDFEYELESRAGFSHVWTPHIAKTEIYRQTGHFQHYKEVMYQPFGIDNEEYVLKPMNCPHHYSIYKSKPRSYRDLPIRLTEPGTCYRYEKSGEVAGLLRVRALTIDDSHILMREDQIESEFELCLNLIKKMFTAFGLHKYYVRLSLADPSDSIKYIADKKTWDDASQILQNIINVNKLNFKIAKGEASFYGPKIDFIVQDSLGRDWQMSTLQLDLFMAKKLGLIYTDEKGNPQYPVIIHRGLTGSLERTLAILIEHYAGAFPLWLSPVQVMIIPVSDKFLDYCQSVYNLLTAANIRVIIDKDNKPLGAKIRQGVLQKIPYLCIIGEKEVAASKNNDIIASIRSREKDLGQSSINEFVKTLLDQVDKKI